jgi:hypothetical protein
LTDKPLYLWQSTMALQDIAGTLGRSSVDRSDDDLRALLAGTPLVVQRDIHRHLRTHYFAADWEHVVWRANRVWDWPDTDAERAAISRAWRDVVLGDPAAYLRYRWDVFADVLMLSTPAVPTVYNRFVVKDGDQVARSRHTVSPSKIQAWLLPEVKELSRAWWFRTWPYFVLALALVPLCVRDRLAFALVASAIAHEAALFFVAPTFDPRYSHWMMTCALVAACGVFATRWRRGAR